MNGTGLVIAGIASILLCGVHVVLGGRECARPLLDAPLPELTKLPLYACWHAITLHLIGSGGLLIWAGLQADSPSTRAVALLVSASYFVYVLVFGFVISRAREPGAWYRFGQWMPFLALTVGGLWAAV